MRGSLRAEWWKLPGPSRFLDAVERDLCRGRHVVVAMPATLDDGSLHDTLVTRIRAAHFRCSRMTGRARPDHSSGLAALARAASVAIKDGPPITADALARAPGFAGQVVLVTEVEASEWSEFRLDLEALAQASRQRSEDDRGLVCVVLHGVPVARTPKEDVTLAVHCWSNITTKLDAALWAAILLADDPLQGLRRRMSVAAIAETAAFDPWLAERLAAGDARTRLDPFEFLKQHGADLGWGQATDEAWHTGTIDSIDGQPTIHASLLAIRGATRDVGRRVWTAQVGVLFPYLEEERLRIVDRCRGLVRVPFDTPWGTIADPADLEIAHLRYQLRGRVPVDLSRRLDDLLALRNGLAHVDAVSFDLVERVLGTAPLPTRVR